MYRKVYPREKYLSRIRPFYDSDIIKVITGIRRCGKSFILKAIINELLSSGKSEDSIIYIALDKRGYKNIKTPDQLETKIEEMIKPGDILLIQFTHNDTSDLVWRHTDEWTSFINNLAIFVDTARLYGAIPVLMTAICRRYWRNGELLESHGEYTLAIRHLASKMGVPLIDLYKESIELVKRLGDEESKKLYLYVERGVYPHYPDGQQDDTHTQKAGAMAYAEITAKELKRLGLI